MAGDMFEVDPKMNSGPNQYSDSINQTGGVMPMDSVTREVVDEVASDYDVDVEYDEGAAHLYGEREEIESFVAEVESAEKTVKQPDHPFESIMHDSVEMGAAAILESNSENPETIADGGFEFEYMEVYEEGEMDSQDLATHAESSDRNVQVYEFGSDGVAIAGSKKATKKFKIDVGLGLGDWKTFYERDQHNEIPMPEEGTFQPAEPQVATDGGEEFSRTQEHYRSQVGNPKDIETVESMGKFPN